MILVYNSVGIQISFEIVPPYNFCLCLLVCLKVTSWKIRVFSVDSTDKVCHFLLSTATTALV